MLNVLEQYRVLLATNDDARMKNIFFKYVSVRENGEQNYITVKNAKVN